MGRRILGGIAMVAVGCVAPAASGATNHEVIRADQAVKRSCTAELHPARTPGVSIREWRAPAAGLLTVRLDGGREGDWDLAVFRRPGGRAVAGSTSVTSTEHVSVWSKRNERFAIQACRRRGELEAVPLRLDMFETALPRPSAERFSLASVPIAGLRDLARLEQLGLDVTHDVSPTAATVALYSDLERAALTAAGFEPQTLIGNLAAADRADRRAEARAAQARGASPLPSGRESYRVYEDYTSEMKRIAESHPGLVRPLVIGTTLEGRPIEGLEIAADVERDDDGRPVYVNMGGHHAREWPSAEFPMELAHDLVDGFGSEPRITALLEDVRVIIIPVVNVDGFIVSRSYGATPLDGDANYTFPLSNTDAAAYKRKNCRAPVDILNEVPCILRSVAFGVDLNRNYGAYWGGPGSGTLQTAQNYRGTGPYSEPESQAVHELSRRLHPTVLITNHTFVTDGTWLRQPGFQAFGSTTPDETAMRQLGDAMAAATGWASQLSWEVGEITGATEDWNYFAQGSYGYTSEARGHNFHADFSDMVVDEYMGSGEQAGLGVREAFLLAGERAADTADHGVIEGSAPPGATLRLSKAFMTPTCQPSCQAPALFVDDVLDTGLKVPASGSYEWHVNPSSRPLVPGEVWTFSCTAADGEESTRTLTIGRGERVRVDWQGGACGS